MTASISSSDRQTSWPSLPLSDWNDTRDTLHRWLQIVGKTRLGLATPVNHYWHVALYPTARGLTTSPMPYAGGMVEVDLDFIDHSLQIRTPRTTKAMQLGPRSVADFYREYTALLKSSGVQVHIWPVPSEMEDELRFTEDQQHRSYDPDAVGRCWTILSEAARVIQRFRGRFLGKCSPVHIFWGAFDLACTRFSGRRAPVHPGGVPHLPDRVARESYSRECISAGWWPGNLGGPVAEPAFYSYAYAEPAGYARAQVRPAAASYNADLKEFILPYSAVRSSARPDETLLDFLQSTYDAGADLAGWDRPLLERQKTE